MAENWQSEYLQFFLFILLTVWLVQAGSPESKPPDTQGEETDADQKVGGHADERSPEPARQGGWRAEPYGWSLGLLMAVIFLGAWAAQAVTGVVAYNEQRLRDLLDPVSLVGYVFSPDFWNRTLQNWQSESLAVASMVVFSIYLRQRGSAESKKVGEPHEEPSG